MERKPAEIKRAVAMAYGPGENAPRVVAKGCGVSAEAIIALAREHGLYVHHSPDLVSLLLQVDLDGEIPPELYQAVAEVLVWLYTLDREHANQSRSGSQPSGSTRR